MRKEEIIRAWRDQDYLLSLSDEQRSLLPANPAATPPSPARDSWAGSCSPPS